MKIPVRTKIKVCFLLVLGIFRGGVSYSQQFVGYGYDNYAGVNSLLFNPAMLADSRYKVNVNLLSMSVVGGNNAYEIDRKKLFGLNFSHLQEGNGYYKSTNNDYKYLYTNVDILGPSAMITLGPRSGLGVITRMRVMGNESNLSNGLFQLLGTTDPNFYNIDINNRSLQTKVHAFAEAGLSYARVLWQNPTNLIKMGITGKYIAGLGIASLSSGQMLVNIDPTNKIAKLTADLTTQYSSNLDNLGGGSFSSLFNKQAGKGWGADLGFIYEWRPAGIKLKQDEESSSDKKPNWLRKDLSTYKIRFGLSLTDLGSVNYTNSTHGQTYTMNAAGHPVSDLQPMSNETYDQYFTRMETNGIIVKKANAASKLNVKLPTAVHINMDWNVYSRIFINTDVLFNTLAETSTLSPNYITTLTMTPRLEKKWFSIYSPVSYNVKHELGWGAGFRFGPLFAGSGTVMSSLFRNRISAADFHVGLTIPIFKPTNKDKKGNKRNGNADTVYKQVIVNSDRDGDGVIDDKDECPDSAGVIALIGCPDKDGDGVADKKDKCPSVPGVVKYGGCPVPDTDGDGINDEEDKCPLIKGLASNHGCPPIKKELIAKVNTAARRIFFIRAKDIIEENCYPELNRLVAILQSDPSLHLHIQGYTDNEGTDERNQKLSERRASAVKAYLLKKGIPDERIKYKGFGSKHPIASNTTPEGRAQNRRVEMNLTNY